MPDLSTLQALLRDVVDTAVRTLRESDDRRGVGSREGQYALDLLVDGPMVDVLLDAGLGVLSEEAGIISSDRALIAVVDPVDGSTNASRGIPWFNTSICVVDDEGPLVSIIENHVTRERFEAVRGHGAMRNGEAMLAAEPAALADSIVGVNGIPPHENPWAQFRTLGASALDISYVAAGALDAYVDFDVEAHGVWDYLGAMLICREVGVVIEDAFERPLHHLDHEERRTPVVARDRQLFEILRDLRRRVP